MIFRKRSMTMQAALLTLGRAWHGVGAGRRPRWR